MIAAIATWLVARGLRPALAKPLIYGTMFAVIVVGLGVAKCTYDSSVIEQHEAIRAAENTAVVLKNERTASQADTVIQQRDEARQSHIQGVIVHAVAEHPQEAARPVGPATAAVLDQLRASPAIGSGPVAEPAR